MEETRPSRELISKARTRGLRVNEKNKRKERKEGKKKKQKKKTVLSTAETRVSRVLFPLLREKKKEKTNVIRIIA